MVGPLPAGQAGGHLQLVGWLGGCVFGVLLGERWAPHPASDMIVSLESIVYFPAHYL